MGGRCCYILKSVVRKALITKITLKLRPEGRTSQTEGTASAKPLRWTQLGEPSGWSPGRKGRGHVA